MCFTASRLSICETGGHSSIKNRPDKWLGGIFVHHSVIGTLIERIVKAERLVFEKFGQVHLNFGFVNN